MATKRSRLRRIHCADHDADELQIAPWCIKALSAASKTANKADRSGYSEVVYLSYETFYQRRLVTRG